MAVTNVRGRQLKDDDVYRQDLNTTVSGSAVIRRVIAGTGISLSSTGVDTGTGDVTISTTATTLNGTGYVKMSGTNVTYVPGASTNVVSTVVERDSSGNFSGNILYANQFEGVNTALNVLRNNLGDPTVDEKALFHGQFNNKFRFVSPTSQEESTNGTTWVASSRATAAQLGDMMRGEGEITDFTAIPAATIGTYGGYRLTWNVVGTTGYVYLNQVYIYNTTQGNNVTVLFEAFHNTNGWTTIATNTSNNWPGHFSLRHTLIPYSNNATHYSQVRLTFSTTHSINANSFQLYGIEWFGGFPAGRRNVQSFDRLRNVTFPANITGTAFIRSGGTASQFLKADGSVDSNTYVTGGPYLPLAGGTVTGQVISTFNSGTGIGAGQIYLNASTNNRIDFNTAGVAAPALTTRSAGTKIVLYPAISATLADYALGIAGSTLWNSVPSSAEFFRWYGGVTNIATLTGAGALSLSAGLTATTGTFSGLVSLASATNTTGISITSDVTANQGSVIRFSKVAATNQVYVTFENDQLYFGIPASNTTDADIGTKAGVNLLLKTNNVARVSLGATGSIQLLPLTNNGFLKTSGSNGTLVVDTNTYLTANQTITLTGNVTGTGTTSIATTIANGVVTNAMLVNSSFNIGTTAISLGRASAAQALTGITSIDGFANNIRSGTITDVSATWTNLGINIDNALQVFRYANTATNKPESLDNANWLINIYSHPSGGVAAYGHQLSGVNNNNIYVRTVTNGSFGPWYRIWTAGTLTNLNQLTNGPGYLTANQTITLSGAVTGSGGTTIATTLSNSVVGIANLSATGTASASTYLRGDNTWATIPSANSTTRYDQSFTATAGQTQITVNNALAEAAFDVYINGVKANVDSFTWTGSTITFVDALAAGDIVDVVNYVTISQVGTAYGSAWTMTGGAGTGTAVFDTVSRTGVALYDVVIIANPNSNGSVSYRDYYYGKLAVTTGFNGAAVVHYIHFIQESPMPRTMHNSGGGNLTVDAVFFASAAESATLTVDASYVVRFKISGYGTTVTGSNTTVFLKQIG